MSTKREREEGLQGAGDNDLREDRAGLAATDMARRCVLCDLGAASAGSERLKSLEYGKFANVGEAEVGLAVGVRGTTRSNMVLLA